MWRLTRPAHAISALVVPLSIAYHQGQQFRASRRAMTANGGYFQVLDFVNRLDRLPRIVVIDSLSLSSGAAGGLTASITARMFVSAAKPVAGSTGTTGSTTTTTTTVPGATTSVPAAGR